MQRKKGEGRRVKGEEGRAKREGRSAKGEEGRAKGEERTRYRPINAPLFYSRFALRSAPFAEFLKCRFSTYSANPQVISIASPVMLLPSFDARNTTAEATCAGSTIRLSAVPSR